MYSSSSTTWVFVSTKSFLYSYLVLFIYSQCLRFLNKLTGSVVLNSIFISKIFFGSNTSTYDCKRNERTLNWHCSPSNPISHSQRALPSSLIHFPLEMLLKSYEKIAI